MATWRQSVTKAKRAEERGEAVTFKTRMETAAASLEQIAPDGKGAEGHTLIEFAEGAGIAYSSLANRRVVWEWLGRDFTAVGKISSYSVAAEAAAADKWDGAAAFIAFTESTVPPQGYTSWTVDAVRHHLKKKPTRPKPVAKSLTALLSDSAMRDGDVVEILKDRMPEPEEREVLLRIITVKRAQLDWLESALTKLATGPQESIDWTEFDQARKGWKESLA